MNPPDVLEDLDSLADLLDRLGGIAPSRIRLKPAPGLATEGDLVLNNNRKRSGLVELVEGTLVEKVMGFGESGVEADLIRFLGRYLDQHDIADLLSSSSTMRLDRGVVRLPDLALIRWERYPHRQRPLEAVPEICPDLAVEILSEGNTPEEMARKRREYFAAGTTLVWEIDPRRREVGVYRSPEQCMTLGEGDVLTAEPLLPGFSLPLTDLFRRVPVLPL